MPKPVVAHGKELFKVRPLIWTAERWRSRLDSVRAFRFTGGAFLPRRPWGTMWVSLNNVSDRLRHVVAARNADGRLEVFGTAADDSIWHNWQTAPHAFPSDSSLRREGVLGEYSVG